MAFGMPLEEHRGSAAAAAGLCSTLSAWADQHGIMRTKQPGIIEIELASGHRLRADASVDIDLLRTLIEALVGR